METLNHVVNRIAVTTLALGLMGSVARANDWPSAGLDPAHGRLSAERSGTVFGAGTWTTSVPGWAVASPVVADGFAITANLSGVVSALRADSGEQVWQVSLGSDVQGTPTIARGRIYVPTSSQVLFALRLADGALLWQRDLGGMTYASPTTVDGDIVITPGFPKTNVVRLSGETGDIVWQSPSVLWQFSHTQPAVGGGLVVVGSQGGTYYAFDVETGGFRWEYAGDGIVNLAAPIIAGGRVYMAGGDQSHHVHAVDAATGKAVAGWPIVLPTPAPDIAGILQGGWRAVSSFAAVDGLLLLQTRLDDVLGPSENGPFNYLSREMVVAIDATSGALVWQHAVARAENTDPNNVPKFYVCPTPAAYRTATGSPLAVVASSLDPVMLVLDAKSGSEQGRHAVAGAALASPVLANGRVFTTSMTGTTQALSSSCNQPPSAPVATRYAAPITIATGTLGWSPAADPDGQPSSYELRIDADGEILGSWQHQVLVDSGKTSTPLPATLVPGVTYTFAVRARDAHDALSPWSAPATFTVTNTPAPPTDTNDSGMDRKPPRIASSDTGPAPKKGAGTLAIETTEIATAGVGCSMAGQSSRGWPAALLVLALVVVRIRARRRCHENRE